MKKKLSTLALLLAVTSGCATGAKDTEKLKKIKKVAVVGFTLDYSMPTSGRLKSVLMGNENNSGGMAGTKVEGPIRQTTLSKKAYQTFVEELRKTGWSVVDAANTKKSPTLNAFYNQKVKKGFLPLQTGHERQKAAGVPQYHYIQSLKKNGKLQKIAKELGVDALVFVYYRALHASAVALGPIGVGTVKYKSNVALDIYDPFDRKNILKMSHNGKKVKLDKSQKPEKNKTLHGSYKAVELATKDLVSKIKKNL